MSQPQPGARTSLPVPSHRFIELSGGMQLNAAGFSTNRAELSGEVILELDFEPRYFHADFNGQLKIIKLGTVGSTAGHFVLVLIQQHLSNSLNSGAATLKPISRTLEQYGIFLFAKALSAQHHRVREDREAHAPGHWP
jgi:hypothetical protein